MISTIIGLILIYLHYIAGRSPFDGAGVMGILLMFPISTVGVFLVADVLKKHSTQSLTAGMCGVRLATYGCVLFVYGRLLLNIQTNERWIICVIAATCFAMDIASLNRLKTK